jgi:predicted MPP superfamily phosphohydrolase
MKRRDFLKSLAAMVGWFAVGCMPAKESAKESAKEAPKETDRRDYYHILLISDLHLPVRTKQHPDEAMQKDILQKKQQLLKTVNAWDDVDEAALLGDLAARYGKESEFVAVDEYLGSLKFPYYAVAGNHDYAYKDQPRISSKGKEKLVSGTPEEKKAKLAAFQKRYKQPDLYYARTVADCRLLYLAPDACGTIVELSQEQLEWMKSEISAHKKGPMFFFCHAPLMGTLRQYRDKINTPKTTAQPSELLAEVLADVPPGSLWISGHTHTPPTNDSYADDSVNRVHKNLVNIHNPTIDTPDIYTNSLFIYKDRTVVRTYDHNKGEWIAGFDRTFPFAGAENISKGSRT